MVKIADNRVVADSMSDSDLKEARLKKVCVEHHRLNLRVEEPVLQCSFYKHQNVKYSFAPKTTLYSSQS